MTAERTGKNMGHAEVLAQMPTPSISKFTLFSESTLNEQKYLIFKKKKKKQLKKNPLYFPPKRILTQACGQASFLERIKEEAQRCHSASSFRIRSNRNETLAGCEQLSPRCSLPASLFHLLSLDGKSSNHIHHRRGHTARLLFHKSQEKEKVAYCASTH